ncbi:MAG: very short patch repair endonuclease [Spirochaetae bacterium HGW-Spirochaetae-8]|jgi:DNA mismatch endonuclease (patch repair protein)|nr:MAG: very short patch repair endonuclease [Spirochaetae bacterium HGW-Spirochaetae-8]
MDTLTSGKRSEVMSRIRGKNTRCELMVRRYLFAQGFRFRIHDKRFPGHPDLVLPKYHTIIMVNGCFWHGHKDCRLYREPKTNREFWSAKILCNTLRDARILAELESLGWRVLIVWECELRTKRLRDRTLNGLVNEIWSITAATSSLEE